MKKKSLHEEADLFLIQQAYLLYLQLGDLPPYACVYMCVFFCVFYFFAQYSSVEVNTWRRHSLKGETHAKAVWILCSFCACQWIWTKMGFISTALNKGLKWIWKTVIMAITTSKKNA